MPVITSTPINVIGPLTDGYMFTWNAAQGGFVLTQPLTNTANTFLLPQILPVIDKGGQVFNVAAYGNDVNAAITAAVAASGGIVQLNTGQYTLNSSLVVNSHVPIVIQGQGWRTLVGAGWADPQWAAANAVTGSVLKFTSADGIKFSSSDYNKNIIVRDIAILGPGTGTGAGINWAVHGDNNTINNVFIANFWDGIRQSADDEDACYYRPVVLACGNAAINCVGNSMTDLRLYSPFLHSSNYGLLIQTGWNYFIHDADIQANIIAGIAVIPTGSPVTNIHVDNAHFEINGQNAILLDTTNSYIQTVRLEMIRFCGGSVNLVGFSGTNPINTLSFLDCMQAAGGSMTIPNTVKYVYGHGNNFGQTTTIDNSQNSSWNDGARSWFTLNTAPNYTTVAGTAPNALNIQPTITPTGDSSSFFTTVFLKPTTKGSAVNFTNNLIGLRSQMAHEGSGLASNLVGLQGDVLVNNTTNISTSLQATTISAGAFNVNHNGSAVVSVGRGINIGSTIGSVSGSSMVTLQNIFIGTPGGTSNVTGVYGLYLQNMWRTGVTNSYGIYLENQTNGTNAIYTNIGKVRFGDSLTINGGANNVQLTVQGFSSQSNNLQEWQNSSSSILVSVASNGTFTVGNTGVGNIVTAQDTFNINFKNEAVPRLSMGRDIVAAGQVGVVLNYNGAGTIANNGTAFYTSASKTANIATSNGFALLNRLEVNNSGNLSLLTGRLNQYYGVATSGFGVPPIYAFGRQTAQTANVSPLASYTLGGADGSFYVSSHLNVTAYTSGIMNVQCVYTDTSNTVRTQTVPLFKIDGTTTNFVSGTGPFNGFPVHIRCKASTSVTLSTASGNGWVGTYNVEGVISQYA